LLGVEPDNQPQAELWIGAHRIAPSMLMRAGVPRPLDAVIAADPERNLGDASIQRLGQGLPYLLKVLAAETPLSLQVHPSVAQASDGFDREDALGIALDSPRRIYRDRNHKPELLCALSEFTALVGFRPVDKTIALLEELSTRATTDIAVTLRTHRPNDALRLVVTELLRWDVEQHTRIVAEVAAACRATLDSGRIAPEFSCMVALADAFPTDIGSVLSLLMNYVRLVPGQAVFLGAGTMHAYLHGVGVELMASSDNVVRCGLTTKHRDVDEMLGVVDFAPTETPIAKTYQPAPQVTAYDVPVPDFCLMRLDLRAEPAEIILDGADIVLCVDGEAHLTTNDQVRPKLDLVKGQAGFIPHHHGRYTIKGSGVVFRASVGAI
jgi:mannose-6-phosphate isomerase